MQCWRVNAALPPFLPSEEEREKGGRGGTPLSTPPSFLPTRLIAKRKRENAAKEEDAKNPTSATSHFPRGGERRETKCPQFSPPPCSFKTLFYSYIWLSALERIKRGRKSRCRLGGEGGNKRPLPPPPPPFPFSLSRSFLGRRRFFPFSLNGDRSLALSRPSSVSIRGGRREEFTDIQQDRHGGGKTQLPSNQKDDDVLSNRRIPPPPSPSSAVSAANRRQGRKRGDGRLPSSSFGPFFRLWRLALSPN